jgi:fumarate reductase subunit C
MKSNPAYREFHPQWYRTRVSPYWWLSQWSYTKFMLRELSSVFVAYVIVITLMQVHALGQGRAEYAAFQELMTRPFVVLLNVVTFLFLLLHTITWFNLTPRAIVLRLGGRRVPDLFIIAPNYVAWLVISGVVAWFVLRG